MDLTSLVFNADFLKSNSRKSGNPSTNNKSQTAG